MGGGTHKHFFAHYCVRMPSDNEMLAALRASSLAELAWSGAGNDLRCHGVVALVRGSTPTIAFTYAEHEVAVSVAAAAEVTLVLSEPRGTGAAYRPLLVRGRPRLEADPDGDAFVEELLEQELRKLPPARLLADSPLLRREHWWYLPRLLVAIEPSVVLPGSDRSPTRDHLLVTAGADGVEILPTGIAAEEGSTLILDQSSVHDGPVPAVLFGQDGSFPDLDRRAQWHYAGQVEGPRLDVEHWPARTGLGAAPGVLERWRRHRRFEQACRRALA